MEPANTTFRVRAGFIPNPKLRLREQLREVMRCKQFSLRTEAAYWVYIRQFILFHVGDEVTRLISNSGWRFLIRASSRRLLRHGAGASSAVRLKIRASGGRTERGLSPIRSAWPVKHAWKNPTRSGLAQPLRVGTTRGLPEPGKPPRFCHFQPKLLNSSNLFGFIGLEMPS